MNTDAATRTKLSSIDYHQEFGQLGIDALADVEWNDAQSVSLGVRFALLHCWILRPVL